MYSRLDTQGGGRDRDAEEEAGRGRHSWCVDTYDIRDLWIHTHVDEYIMCMHV